jgi:hypothetical protein
MRKSSFRGHLLWAPALCSLLPLGARALEPDKIFEKASPSVWIVRALDAQQKPIATGSAVVIGPGKLITTCTVLRQGRSIQVSQDNVSHVATLEFPDADRDLCQLTAPGLKAPVATIVPMSAARIGQRVYAIGSPRGLETTLSEGLISSLRGGEGGAPLILHGAPLATGSSGGGLFDTEGRLAGITIAQRRDAQSQYAAIPAEWIAEVPERGQAALDKRREAAIAPKPATVAVAPATGAATTPTQTTVDGEFPKQITGEAFSKFFQTYRTLEGSMTGRHVRLVLGGSYVDTYTNMPIGGFYWASEIPPSVRGRKRQDNARNEICFGFVGVVSSFWRGMEGCYQLVQTSANEYLLRPVKDATEFRFALK